LFYISTNSGITWIPPTHIGTFNQNAPIACSADGTKLAVALSNDGIYTSTNSGSTWTSNNVVSPASWSCIASSADGQQLVAGIGPYNSFNKSIKGSIYISTNSGVSWTSNGVNQAWTAIASSADGTKLVAADYGGTIYTSTNSGNTWTSNNFPYQLDWTSVASSADGSKLIAVSDSPNYGIWTSKTIPTPQLNIAPTNSNFKLSWIVLSTNFVLQQNLDLTTTNWVTLTNTPTLNLTNLQNKVVLSPSNSSGFYRLATQ
jgi:photosystem II stability/assembly factor-like uncharacterized protein